MTMEEKENRYERMLKNGSVWRAIFTMAVPALATIVIMIFYTMADMFFIAQLGDTAKVASVSIISPVFGMIMALATMIGVGSPMTRVGSPGSTFAIQVAGSLAPPST